MKEIIGDDDDYIITGSPLMFGAAATPTNCVVDEELCFTFEAAQDSIKEEEEKFKIYLSTADTGIKLYRDQGHISVLTDDSDGMSFLSLFNPRRARAVRITVVGLCVRPLIGNSLLERLLVLKTLSRTQWATPKICGDLPETTAFKRYAAKQERRSQYANYSDLPVSAFSA